MASRGTAEGGWRRVGVILYLDHCYFTQHGGRQQPITAPYHRVTSMYMKVDLLRLHIQRLITFFHIPSNNPVFVFAFICKDSGYSRLAGTSNILDKLAFKLLLVVYSISGKVFFIGTRFSLSSCNGTVTARGGFWVPLNINPISLRFLINMACISPLSQ